MISTVHLSTATDEASCRSNGAHQPFRLLRSTTHLVRRPLEKTDHSSSRQSIISLNEREYGWSTNASGGAGHLWLIEAV